MKILNIFKKDRKNTGVSSIKKLEKKQLEKVIGGAVDNSNLFSREGLPIRAKM